MNAVRMVPFLGLALLSASPGSSSPFPEALSRPLLAAARLERANPWTWPPRAAFERRWSERTQARASHLLIRGRVEAVRERQRDELGQPKSKVQPTTLAHVEALRASGWMTCVAEGWYVERTDAAGTAWLDPVVAPGDSWCGRLSWKVLETLDSRRALDRPEARARFLVLQTVGGEEVPQGLLEEWTYVATLLHSDVPIDDPQTLDPPGLFGDVPQGPDVAALLAGGAAGRRALLERLDALHPEDSSRWQTVGTWARKKSDLQLLREYYRRFRPMGRCSMDNFPMEHARAYADFCFEQGDLACFLQLQVRIMGDQFDRVAWSSMGDARAGTQVQRLEQTGVDTTRFLRGLLLRLPGDRAGEINAPRLARAMLESKTGEAFLEELPRLAADAGLDPYNRLRATQAWVALLFRTGSSWSQVEARLAARKLHPVAAAWWEQLRQEEREQ